MKRNQRGFTLAELLIVVAIIAVLVGVAIPVFTSQLEKSRESTDFSNVRSAYAEVMMAVNSDDATATYKGTTIKQGDGVYRAVVAPLNQKQDGWTTNVENMAIGGVPSDSWQGTPQSNGSCSITVSSDGTTQIAWGNGYAYMPLSSLHNVDNSKRVQEDQKTLKALGSAVLSQGWSKAQLMQYLGLPESTGSAIRIADYYQLKNGTDFSDYSSAGFMVTSKPDGKLEDLLKGIGYDSGSVLSADKNSSRANTTYENPLFYSDQLGANQFGYNGSSYDISQTKRSIIIDNIQEKDGKITSLSIYTKAMDGQANLNSEDKALFKFSIK